MRNEILDEIGDQLIAMAGDTPEQVAEVLAALAESMAEKTEQSVEDVLKDVASTLGIDSLHSKPAKRKLTLANQLGGSLDQLDLDPSNLTPRVVEILTGSDFAELARDLFFKSENAKDILVPTARLKQLENLFESAFGIFPKLTTLYPYHDRSVAEASLKEAQSILDDPKKYGYDAEPTDEKFKPIQEEVKRLKAILETYQNPVNTLVIMSVTTSGFENDLDAFASKTGIRIPTIKEWLKAVQEDSFTGRNSKTPHIQTIEQWFTPLREHLITQADSTD